MLTTGPQNDSPAHTVHRVVITPTEIDLLICHVQFLHTADRSEVPVQAKDFSRAVKFTDLFQVLVTALVKAKFCRFAGRQLLQFPFHMEEPVHGMYPTGSLLKSKHSPGCVSG